MLRISLRSVGSSLRFKYVLSTALCNFSPVFRLFFFTDRNAECTLECTTCNLLACPFPRTFRTSQRYSSLRWPSLRATLESGQALWDQSRRGATCSEYRLRASLIEVCALVDNPDCCEWYFCPSLCCSEDRRSRAARTRVACGLYFRGHVTRALFGYTS